MKAKFENWRNRAILEGGRANAFLMKNDVARCSSRLQSTHRAEITTLMQFEFSDKPNDSIK